MRTGTTMGVIYKILKQQRQQQQQRHGHGQGQGLTMDLRLSTATKCKMQAAIKQRQQQQQQQRRLEDHLQVPKPEPVRSEERDHDKEELAEQQLQQLCRFLAENASRKKRQSFKLRYDSEPTAELQEDPEQEREREREREQVHLLAPEMDLIEQLHHAHSPFTVARGAASTAPRDSILMKIRHQIFERKRQQQRQLAELVQQRLVVWRPW
ncbi:adenylate cyclase, terminal-differentiation specific [Drosophila obscura]|uniref:adenylate cyclase, terminal-differentiation specific n=1 Tax=Drosophila obscura TaxID=7282 RepID=UPI001BB0E170|nr:adenylate cyclase, terminal-differentiation specific [Drosophila obscura]